MALSYYFSTWAGLCIVSHFLCNSMVQPQPMQPCIPESKCFPSKSKILCHPRTHLSAQRESGLPLLRPSSVSPYYWIEFTIKFANFNIFQNILRVSPSPPPLTTPSGLKSRIEKDIGIKDDLCHLSPDQDRVEIQSSLLSSPKTSQPCTPELCNARRRIT